MDNSAPGFVYFNTNQNKADTPDFISFSDNTNEADGFKPQYVSSPRNYKQDPSPGNLKWKQNRGRGNRNFGNYGLNSSFISPNHSGGNNNWKQRRSTSGIRYSPNQNFRSPNQSFSPRGFNNSNNSHNSSQSSRSFKQDSRGEIKADISQYYDPYCLEDPWKNLEDNLKRKWEQEDRSDIEKQANNNDDLEMAENSKKSSSPDNSSDNSSNNDEETGSDSDSD